MYNSDGYAKSIILPSNTVQCEDVVGIDGQIPYSEKYNPLPIDISGYIENKNFNKEGFINWLGKKGEREFQYVGSDKKIKVVRDSEVELEIYNSSQALFECSFTAYNPYWLPAEEKVWSQNTPTLNTEYRFTSFGNVDSKPISQIETAGTNTVVRSELNGVEFQYDKIMNSV